MGYGGSCFPKDVQALIHTASEHNLDFALLRAAEAVNRRQKRLIPARVKQHFGQNLSGRTFAIWGLAFKPRTDDMREAPSLVVIEELLQAGAKCRVHDPEALENARKIFGDRVTYHKTNYEALEGCRRAADSDRVERVPASQFSAHQGRAEGAGDIRRPEPV